MVVLVKLGLVFLVTLAMVLFVIKIIVSKDNGQQDQ